MQTKEIILLPGCPANFRQRGERSEFEGEGEAIWKAYGVRDMVNVQVQGDLFAECETAWYDRLR